MSDPLSALVRLANGAEHRPIFRWRWKAYKDNHHPWQYTAPEPDGVEAIQLWNLANIEVEIVTPEVVRDALDEAFIAGEMHEKFGLPNDALYRRLGYRKCRYKRAWSIENRRPTGATP